MLLKFSHFFRRNKEKGVVGLVSPEPSFQTRKEILKRDDGDGRGFNQHHDGEGTS